jgi:4Fe-4S ferredoxin
MSKCNQPAGKYIPLIDRNKCEGKAACVAVCPYGVLQIDQLPVDQRATLGFFGKVKGLVHDWQQAFVVEPDLCRACALCVQACPEQAIKLIANDI